MGAVHKLDLTSDVTHLVVGDSDTPKYKFVAKERPDVSCVLPSWIEAVRAAWLEGGETNVEELEREHRLPTFTGLKLCVTGFNDLVYRKELEDLISDNGGEYSGNLTKDVSHLIAKEPSSDKYNYAGQWGIKIVAVEWLKQSLERGMILEETLYHLSIPPSERGRNAWIRRSASTTSLGKRTRGDELAPQNSRKLRRTASARLSSQNVGLWTDIVGAEVKAEGNKVDAWEDLQTEALNNKVTTVATDAEDLRATSSIDHGRQQIKRNQSEVNIGSILSDPMQHEGLFQGKTIMLRDFDEKKTAILQEHLRSHGAEIVNTLSQLPSATSIPGDIGKGFLLIPHTTSASDICLNSSSTTQPIVVTDLWVERCLYQKKFEEPQEHVTNVPFPRDSIPGFEDLAICSTGFQGIDLVHMSKAAKLMGATYDEYFTPTSSVLICHTVVPGHEKLSHARLWAVPAVKPKWLWDSIRKGKFMPFGPYLVQSIRDSATSSKDVEAERRENGASRAVRSGLSEGRERKVVSSSRTMTSPKENYRDSPRDTPLSTEIQKQSKGSSAELPSAHRRETQTPPIYTDSDTPIPIHSNPENDSSHALDATSTPVPLQEITPNSSPTKQTESPPKSLSPIKSKDPPSPQPSKQPSQDSSLGPTISSLLAHHQRSNTNPPPSNSSDQPRPYRRRRQLLGRAPSNLSSHSNGINFSRASSVDTINTDGLGTPLEPSNATKAEQNPNDKNKSMTEFPMFYSAEQQQDDPDRVDEQQLQMTQLGYEDPDVAAWRERVAVKMGGGKVKGTTPGRKGANAATTVAGREEASRGLGIAKRTRLATGR